MMTQLFNGPPDQHFNMRYLRELARREVSQSSLIRHAAVGEKEAAIALHIGFWPFVHDFELAIDRHTLDRQPLISRFGSQRVREGFVGIAKAVKEMKEEEGIHSTHWVADAKALGISTLESPTRAKGVEELIASSNTLDHTRFFAVLAGTEFIAEELGRFLTSSRLYTNLFVGRERWVWGEVHLIPHDNGPSHLEIDMDLALAYSTRRGDGAIIEIAQHVEETIHLFGEAARDVEKLSFTLSAAAAE